MKLFNSTIKSNTDLVLDSIKALLYNEFHNTRIESYDNNEILDDIYNTRVKDVTPDQWVKLIVHTIREYGNRNNEDLSNFSDEAIINEMNRRIQNGVIDSAPRFYVSNKGAK